MYEVGFVGALTMGIGSGGVLERVGIRDAYLIPLAFVVWLYIIINLLWNEIRRSRGTIVLSLQL